MAERDCSMDERQKMHEDDWVYKDTRPISDEYTKAEIDEKLDAVDVKFNSYLSLDGGALTGNIIERNTDNDHLGISGSYWGHGAYLWLSGQNSGYAGAWYLSARDTEKSCDLIGSPAGVLSWGGKLVLTEDDLASKADKSDLNNYLPISGGQMTGSAISRDTDDSVLQLRGGATYTTGSYLTLCGKDYSSSGVFTVTARDGTNSCTLRGTPSGTLTWGNKTIDVIEEQGDGYIRYSNGIQICWGTKMIAGGVTSADILFPKPFQVVPAISANIQVEDGEQFATLRTCSASGFGCVRNVGYYSCFVYFSAIGKWK